MDVKISQQEVIALIGQKELDKLALQQELNAANAEITRLTLALEKAEKPNG
jgi:hypothetical protein